MLAAASTATRSEAFTGAATNGSASRRKAAATAPSLGTVVMKAAMAGVVPAVTSGTQKCTGTAPALKATPASTPRTPTAASGAGASESSRATAA
jgi:hypothetical protein